MRRLLLLTLCLLLSLAASGQDVSKQSERKRKIEEEISFIDNQLKAITSEPDNPTYLDTYAWILHLLGDDVEAKAIFKHAMLYGGKEQPAVLDHYAEVLYALKEYDLAYIYWNQAKALDTTGELKIEEKIRERKKNQ